MTNKQLISVLGITFFLISGCNKDPEVCPVIPPPAEVCNVQGTYTGTNTASTGGTSSTTYKLKENNFIVGSSTPEGPAVTFGGYRNTCDSVIFSVFYTGNSSYYLLKGKLSNNRNTIAGSFQNLTTPSDFGTFTMSK